MLAHGLIRGAVVPAVGGGLGIALMIALADAASLPLMLAPFTTSVVLVMAAPNTPYARSRNVIGGHLLSAVAGLIVAHAFGATPWFAALAVGLAIAAMQMTDTMHPPAGINALIMVVAHPPWTFVLMPVLMGAVCLVAFAHGYHRATARITGASGATADAEPPPPVARQTEATR